MSGFVSFLVICALKITAIQCQLPVNCYSCSSPASGNILYASYLPIVYNVPWISPDCSNNPETGAVSVAYSCPNKCYSVSSYNLTIRGCSDGLITPNGWNAIHPNLTATTSKNGCYTTTQGNVLGNGVPTLVYLCFCSTSLCNNVHESTANEFAKEYLAYAYRKTGVSTKAQVILLLAALIFVSFH